MDILLENEHIKKFVSADGDEMQIFFGKNGEPDRLSVCFIEEHRVRALLPQVFERLKPLADCRYYDEMVRLFPQYKNAERLTEKQIQALLIEKCGDFMIDGRHAVLLAEEYLGIKVGEEYNLLDGLSPRYFHLQLFYDFGCAECLRCIERHNECAVELAYMWAWQNLHFKNYEQSVALGQLTEVYLKLKSLNPQLENLQINEKNLLSLQTAVNGVMYGFPVADIELFCNEIEKGISPGKAHNERVRQEMAENGLPNASLLWLPATETIVDMGKRYQAKKSSF